MPLHLLGKKSWNVYNQDNIEKVRRDEATAKAKEEAEEQRMQENDAERRLAILRGESPPPLLEDATNSNTGAPPKESRAVGFTSKKRKRHGEDDTDFEMRLAHTRTENRESEKTIVLHKGGQDAPLVGTTGHIDLFPEPINKPTKSKNPEAERELARKKKEYEDQFTMRFENAAGFKQGIHDAWYSKVGPDREEAVTIPSKDVWGNEDPRRRDREEARTTQNDPLAAMRAGASKVRQVAKERKQWLEDQMADTEALRRAERSEMKRRHASKDDCDDLENFHLDAVSASKASSQSRKESRHKHHRRSSRMEDTHHNGRLRDRRRPVHNSRVSDTADRVS